MGSGLQNLHPKKRQLAKKPDTYGAGIEEIVAEYKCTLLFLLTSFLLIYCCENICFESLTTTVWSAGYLYAPAMRNPTARLSLPSSLVSRLAVRYCFFCLANCPIALLLFDNVMLSVRRKIYILLIIHLIISANVLNTTQKIINLPAYND